jgi:hypothetical protein
MLQVENRRTDFRKILFLFLIFVDSLPFFGSDRKTVTDTSHEDQRPHSNPQSAVQPREDILSDNVITVTCSTHPTHTTVIGPQAIMT